tara:strand:+ start:8183 stop:8530 length:348 start_codon:yes stop_codon:yes gene_type:complete
MQRIIIYAIILGVFTLIINLLKNDNNFKGLTYDSTIIDVVAYVSASFSGCGYIGIHPTSKIAKILIMLLSILKYVILIEVLLAVSPILDNYDIFKGVENIIKLEEKNELTNKIFD